HPSSREEGNLRSATFPSLRKEGQRGGQACDTALLLLYQMTIDNLSTPVGNPKDMKEQSDVWQGTLVLMVLKTLNILGPQHGYGIARRIEQTSGERLSINPGTLYHVLL